MSYFPFFIDIQGKEGLVVGGGRVAVHKVEKLKPFGAKLTVIAPLMQEELSEDQTLTCLQREFVDSDILEKSFVIAASDNRELNALLVEKARQGKNVVRLKGGDPFVFGRGGEELQAVREAGIEVEEIPGITSAIAVPAAAGIPVTHRGLGRSFHVITGHTADSSNRQAELAALAKLEGTCVFLMGFTHLKEIAEGLIASGKSSDTPVAVVHGGFDTTVQVVRGTLADIACKVEQSDIQMPAVIVVGGTAGMEL